MTAKNISLEGTTEEDSDSEIFLSSNDDSCNQCWIMDYRTNGTFLIVSETTNHLVLTCDGSLECMKLLMRRFTGDENQLWRFDGTILSLSSLRDTSLVAKAIWHCTSKKRVIKCNYLN